MNCEDPEVVVRRLAIGPRDRWGRAEGTEPRRRRGGCERTSASNCPDRDAIGNVSDVAAITPSAGLRIRGTTLTPETLIVAKFGGMLRYYTRGATPPIISGTGVLTSATHILTNFPDFAFPPPGASQDGEHDADVRNTWHQWCSRYHTSFGFL